MAYQLAQENEQTEQIAVYPVADVSQGDIATFNDTTGFYLADVATGKRGVLVIRATIVKVNGAAVDFLEGENVYDDGLTGTVTNVVGTTAIGKVYEAQDNTGGAAEIKITFHGGNG